jgi:RHS repeat-associated protein
LVVPVGGGDKTGVSSQAIVLPQGSGKIQGMGESFSTQLSTGVATFTVPLQLAHARGGAQPGLSLSYSSSGGHGLAGVGWDVGWGFIARQTDRGLPTYDDRTAWHPQQDRFVFGGGQELVPICTVQGTSCTGALTAEVMPTWGDGWQYFRARVEGSYLRFFWSPDHRTWRVEAKSGETLELGVPLDGSGYTGGLESDPAQAGHIFRWNLVRQYDSQGAVPPAGSAQPAPVNVVAYRYTSIGAVAYLTDIYDTPPAAGASTAPLSTYAHHTRLVWETRPDSTFSYRRGWRVDQTQRLVGVDVTSMPFDGGQTRHAVRRYHLSYDATSHVSLLTSVQMEGRCVSTDRTHGGGEANAPAESAEQLGPTTCGRLPALTLGYQHVTPLHVDGSQGTADLPGYEGFDERLIPMADSPPNSIDENATDLFDINGDSLPDVVVTLPGTDSQFPLYFNGASGIRGQFGASRLGVLGVLGATSTTINLVNDNVAVSDIDGDGIIDWLHQPAVKQYAVYTPRQVSGTWWMVGREVPASAQQDPHLDLGEDTPDIDVVDANGDGLVDVVRTTGTEMQTFFSLGRFPGGDGNFGSAQWTGAFTAALSLQFVPSCVPLVSPGVPVRFGDGSVRLADMNGDGLQDIVHFAQGNIQYWPGRGDGSWGTGALGSCTSGFAENNFIAMSNAPQYSDPSGGGLRLDDVNGDGLDDLVQVRFDAIDAWLNVDGVGWTADHVISGVTPAQGPAWVGKVRLVDVNGSGTRDIMWGEGGDYRYMDLAGAKRPWVLTHVDNGLGKTTDIEYATAAEQMLAAEAAGKPWTSKSPTTVHVVSRVSEHDNLSVVGLPAGTYETDYTYRDAVYDGRQREFRGFRTTTSKRIGDTNSPTSLSTSEFLLGECADDEPAPAGLTSRCVPEGRWADNGREALKGLPVVTESFDETGVYLSTTHTTYTLRKLYTGLDGREVRVAFASQTDTWSYDTSGFASSSASTGVPDVTLDQITGPEPSTPLPASVRAAAGTAHTRTATVVDLFGNTTDQVALGCVDGAACPTADESITTSTRYRRLVDGSGWLFRPIESFVVGRDSVKRKDTFTLYDGATDAQGTGAGVPNGNATGTQAQLGGTAQLDRFMNGSTTALTAGNAAPNASHDGLITLSQVLYDGYGNVIGQAAPNGRCRQMLYMSDYQDLPTQENLYVGAAGPGTCTAGGGPQGAVELSSKAGYDRGLGIIVDVIDLHFEPSRFVYDEFGRFTSMKKPSAVAQVLSASPSTLVDYDLAIPSRPYSIVHTQTMVGTTESDGTYRDSYAYVDGLGRTVVTLDEADPNAGDGGQWILDALTSYDAKGAEERKYLASFWTGDARAYPLSQGPTTSYSRQRYDAFARPVQSFGLDGIVTSQITYHALSVDTFDAADILPGPHQGSPASTRKDGHGRPVVATERFHNGNAIESHETRTTYLSTGEPQIITRVRVGASDGPVVRWIVYDTLGRMVINAEPDTTTNFSPDPSTASLSPSAVKSWRYAYNDNGELVGTSDARGCGENFYYDTAGRILAEDYSPCLPPTSTPDANGGTPTQPAYSAPDPSGNGTEVLYEYDALDDATKASLPAGFALNTNLLSGRVVSISDRGAQTVTNYDGRGNVVGKGRRIVAPGVPSDTVASRYAPHWYVQTTGFDAADRPISVTTGVDSDIAALLDASGQSSVTMAYSLRNVIASVGSGYGPLVTSIVRAADGPITQIVYGDVAATTTTSSYDSRRRLSSVQTYRGTPALWATPPATYTPAPDTNPADPPTTLQLLLADLDYQYDVVDNPIAIRDWRNPAEWPAGAQPVSRTMQYDDLNRVRQVTYSYPNGADAWVSPFDAEDKGINADPRRANPSPHGTFANRILRESFQFDWLGNTVATDDDAHGFYDRSLGTISNGLATAGPYQLTGASSLPSAAAGQVTGVQYDAAGNLTAFTVLKRGPGVCPVGATDCAHAYGYEWDEIGRLARARRWDTDAASLGDPDAQLDYAYDASDERVLKTATEGAVQTFTATIFDTFDLRGTTFDGTDYERSAMTEVGYLSAHDVRLARLHYAPSAPSSIGAPLHVLFELSDYLGSTSMVVDKDSSELVEESTYTAFGNADSDYRPTRWNSFREDFRFTGKEDDVEFGLAYFGKRFFSTPLGRWVSPDPLAVHRPGNGDENLYAYVQGAVLRATDPLGLDTAWITFPHGAADNGMHRAAGKFVDTWASFPKGTPDFFVTRHKVSVPAGPSLQQLKTAWTQAAKLAGRGGTVVYTAHAGADEWTTPHIGFAPMSIGQTHNPWELRLEELRHISDGASLSKDEKRFAAMLTWAKDALRANHVSEVEFVSCNIGNSREYVGRLADLLGVKVTAYLRKSRFPEDGTDSNGRPLTPAMGLALAKPPCSGRVCPLPGMIPDTGAEQLRPSQLPSVIANGLVMSMVPGQWVNDRSQEEGSRAANAAAQKAGH